MGASRQMNWEKSRLATMTTGKTTISDFDDAAYAGSGQFDLAEMNRRFPIIVDGDGGVPDFNALIAEKACTGDEAGLPDQGQADELPGDALHPCGDIGDNRWAYR
jgi:hypothetical protein